MLQVESRLSPALLRNPGRPRKACTWVTSPQKYRITLSGWDMKAFMWKYGKFLTLSEPGIW